jgi:hypothetical protein
MDGRKGMAAFKSESGSSKIFLQLEPDQSVIVKVFDRNISGEKWNYHSTAGTPYAIKGKYEVAFISGGETIPHKEEISELTSWTEWKSDQSQALKGFSGTARYKVIFDKPAGLADDYFLSLGEVCHSAKVILNGKEVGELISSPMMLLCGKELKNGKNILEVEVANTAINRVADLDLHDIKWYHETSGMDLSLCDWDFKKKDSSWIPLKSGLIGPVQLIPVNFIKP